jgi:hypothetical protein
VYKLILATAGSASRQLNTPVAAADTARFVAAPVLQNYCEDVEAAVDQAAADSASMQKQIQQLAQQYQLLPSS